MGINDDDLKSMQKVNIFTKQLPYPCKVNEYAVCSFTEIKLNLSKSLVFNELRPGFTYWSEQLLCFLDENGLFFTKQDHIQLIKIYLEVIQLPEIDLIIVELGLDVLTVLLKEFSRIERKDLIIEWRPLFELYRRIDKALTDYNTTVFMPIDLDLNSFALFIAYACIYFPIESTQEMLDEWRPMLCPFSSSIVEAFKRFELFLPTYFYEHEIVRGYKLWFNEFLDLWTTLSVCYEWEPYLLRLFTKVAQKSLGEFNWAPYIPFIFSNMLRGFGLPCGSKKKANLKLNMDYTEETVYSCAQWIVALIGSQNEQKNDICLEHLNRLFQALRSFYHPSNSGPWSTNLFLFLKYLPKYLIVRISREKQTETKWYFHKKSVSYYINKTHVDSFVNALREVTFTAMFSPTHHLIARKAFLYLTFLNGEIMLPPLVDKLNESITSLIEPDRYTKLLSCAVAVAREMTIYSPEHALHTQLYVIPLLSAVLPGIDPNDSNKSMLTFEFIDTILSNIIVCDCSHALHVRSDLSEHEKELIFQTIKFEDFIHELLDKILNFLDNLSFCEVDESSETAALASNSYAIDNSTHKILLQVFQTLMRQSSKQILKIILNKVKLYVNANSFNIKCGKVASYLCSYLVTSAIGDQAFVNLLEFVYESLSKFKNDKTNYEHFIQNERYNIEVTWNFQLLSQIVKVNGACLIQHMARINEIFSWFRQTISLDAFNYIGFTFENILMSLSSLEPTNFSSVNYSIIFDNENEFFTKHLPIRDWGCRGDIDELNLNYHKPTVNELSTAIKFMDSELNKSIEFLTQSVLNSQLSSDQLTNTIKKERLREITYIYFLLLGGSQILKRSCVNSELVINHIDTNVLIGISDNVDKGLGFEYANMFDQNHEYFQLNSEDRSIMLNKRQVILDFIQKLVVRLIDKQTSEISLLNICSTILNLGSSQYTLFFNSYENIWAKKYFNNILHGKKHCGREEIIQKVMAKYRTRSAHLHTILNISDVQVIDTLFRLSTESIYSSVRATAQKHLLSLLGQYNCSFNLLVPKLVKILKRSEDNKLTHDQLKGCLHLIESDSFVIKENWPVLSELWPLLFKFQKFQKPSIQQLLDTIHIKICDNFETFNNCTQLSDSIVKMAIQMAVDSKSASLISNEEITNRLDWFKIKFKTENESISNLMVSLIRLADDLSINQPHLIYNLNGMLLDSCRTDKSLLTHNFVQFYLDALINDDLQVREVANAILCKVLKLLKPKKLTQALKKADLVVDELSEQKPGLRNDNQWHLYDPCFLSSLLEPTKADTIKWNEAIFIDKSYLGYYCWPMRYEINLNYQPQEEVHTALTPVEYKFKHFKKFFEKFIELSLVEDIKGNEQFELQKFYLFKSLFRIWSSTDIIPNLYKHLKNLISNPDKLTQERSHKLAAELMTGLVIGSKYWPLNDLKAMWIELKEVFDLIIENLNSENIELWEIAISMIFKDQDPRRMVFYLNYLTDLVKNQFVSRTSKLSSSASFKQSSCLKLIILALEQFEWRAPALIESLFTVLLSNMSNSSLLVRQINSECLRICTTRDIDYSFSFINSTRIKEPQNMMANNAIKNKLDELIDYIEIKLNKLIDLYVKNSSNASSMSVHEKNHEVMPFLQSFFDWLLSYLTSSYQPINCSLLKIIPQICSIDKIVAQDVYSMSKLNVLRKFLSTWILDSQTLLFYLSQLKKVITLPDWRSRLTAVHMIQNIGSYNLFLINDFLRNEIMQMLVDCLCDEQLEVRLCASHTLTGFLHSNLVQVDQDLIDKFKNLCKFSIKKRDISGMFRLDPQNLIKKHGGILGLCSIVNAYPYDVPSFLPDCVTYLCEFINDTNPIQESVRKCLNEFRRTHHDNWQENKLKFNDSQLMTLADILISPSYYA